MSKAFYWYRPHPYFDSFYPGKMLNLISDPEIFNKYFSSSVKNELIKKYFPHGLSPRGLSMCLNRRLENSDVIEPITDIIFELIRQLHFPNAPSRLSSLYATESIKQALQWESRLYVNKQSEKSLWEIEFQTDAHLYDASFLDITPNDTFSFLSAIEHAYSYWSGHFSENPLPELLVPYPAIVIRNVLHKDVMFV